MFILRVATRGSRPHEEFLHKLLLPLHRKAAATALGAPGEIRLMLYMVIVSHTAESCPGREGNEEVHPCLQTMNDLVAARGIGVVGRWADPPAHVSFMVLDAPNAHLIQEILMESGVFAHTTTEVRPVLSMD